nr:aerobic respiration two-component sensor histidine kinase ArcB [Psychromonas sp. CD1]
MSIFNLKTWVYYYVELLKRLGAFRFSLILAFAIISSDSLLQILLAYYFHDTLDITALMRSFILGLLITPWAVYFLTVVMGDLEEARQRLDNTVVRLQVMLNSDHKKAQDLEKEIIERQRTQLQLEEGSILLRSFLDTSPDLVFHRDLKGCFVNCNKAMQKLMGKTEQQMLGLTPFDIYDDVYARQVVQHDQQIKDTQQEQLHEYWFQYPNGRQACFEIRSFPLINTKKQCVGIIGFGRDITERKRHQESLEKASRDKTTFIATISHELRTPLNGIVGLSRMLLDEPLSVEQRQYMKTIHMSAITLGNIFNDIVDLDKLDRRRLNLVSNHINMYDFVNDLKSLAFIQTEQKGLLLNFEQGSMLPDNIEADDTRLRQVLWNLISNAVKFTQQGHITIRLFAKRQNDQHAIIYFEVEDSGIGMQDSELDKIFSLYYQVQGNLHATGTGIGLAVSQQIVNAMGGKLSVKSVFGKGSTFTFSLPVHCPKENKKKALVTPLPYLFILLVEDIELNILVAKSLLEKLGHRVDVAKTGQQALDKMAINSYQLILMDIQLPDMDGFQVTQTLRALYGKSLPPIVALTANVFSDKSVFLEKGMDDALGKPLNAGLLNEMIARLFLGVDKTDNHKKIESTTDIDTVLNKSMLLELLEFISTAIMLENVILFKKVMPKYLQILDSHMTAKNKKGIVNEAHKIKGAASAVGLMRIQLLAQKLQSPELPAWWDNIDDWLSLLKSQYQSDIIILQHWLVE